MDQLRDGSIHCTSSELANFWGLNLRKVQRLTQEGVISKLSPAKNAKFDLQKATAEYIEHLTNKANGKEVKASEAAIKEKKLVAETALKESQAELHKLKTEVSMGKYLSIDEIRLDYAKFFVIFKKFAQGLPGRLMAYVNGYIDPVEAREVESKLNQEINNSLRSFVVAGTKEGGTKEGVSDEEEKPKANRATRRKTSKTKSKESKS